MMTTDRSVRLAEGVLSSLDKKQFRFVSREIMKSKLRQSGLLVVGLFIIVMFSMAAHKMPPATVTYTKDIAPIINKSCAECHRTGEIAPMSLMNYAEVRPWAKSIREQVVSRQMPPWSADPKVGHWANDPSLSQKEIDTITTWVAAGAPKGDDKDMPAPPNFTQGWTIGKPDVVFTMPEEYTVPADGTIPYLYFTMPTNFTEDKWVQAIEIRPSNRMVVHHVIAYAQAPGAKSLAGGGEGDIGGGRQHLTGITPNKTGNVFAPGTSRLIKKGSNIVFQMHYTTNGQVGKDRTSIGFVFTKEPATQEILTGNVMDVKFAIPAGADNHEVKSSRTFKEDIVISSFSPHMHVRGKSITYTAFYPDGHSEVLLNVPHYDFNWQHSYVPKEAIKLPKGTRLEVVAHFDNSTKNKYNPDPSQTVRWGDQTWEEMMIGWYTATRPIDQPKAQVTSSSSSSR